MLKSFLVLCVMASLISGTFSCAAQQHQHTPGAESRGQQPESANPGLWLALLFRNHISAVDGDRCPSIPTCSAYSAEVFSKHGFFKGWLMTVDRLIHEADEGDYSPLEYRDGKVRILDPPESNEIW